MINGPNPLQLQLIALKKEYAASPSFQVLHAIFGLELELIGKIPEAIKYYQQSGHTVALSRLYCHFQFTHPTTIAQLQPQPVYHKQPQPVYHEQPQPVYHDQPQPVYHEQPQPVYHEQPQPVYHEQPQPAYHGQPQPVYHQQPGYYGTPLFNHYRQPVTPMPTQYPRQPIAVHIHNNYRDIPHTVLQTQLHSNPPTMNKQSSDIPAEKNNVPSQSISSKHEAATRAIIDNAAERLVRELNPRQKTILLYLFEHSDNCAFKKDVADALNLRPSQLRSTCSSLISRKLITEWPNLSELGIQVSKKIKGIEQQRQQTVESGNSHPLIIPMTSVQQEPMHNNVHSKTLLPLRNALIEKIKRKVPSQALERTTTEPEMTETEKTEVKKQMSFSRLNNQ